MTVELTNKLMLRLRRLNVYVFSDEPSIVCVSTVTVIRLILSLKPCKTKGLGKGDHKVQQDAE